MKFFHILLLLGLLFAVANSQFQSSISDLYDDDNDAEDDTDDDDDNTISYDDDDDYTFDSDADSPLSPSDRRERPSNDPFVIGQSDSASAVMPCLLMFSIVLFVLSF